MIAEAEVMKPAFSKSKDKFPRYIIIREVLLLELLVFIIDHGSFKIIIGLLQHNAWPPCI